MHVNRYSRARVNSETMLAGVLQFTRGQDASVMTAFGIRLHVIIVSLLE